MAFSHLCREMNADRERDRSVGAGGLVVAERRGALGVGYFDTAAFELLDELGLAEPRLRGRLRQGQGSRTVQRQRTRQPVRGHTLSSRVRDYEGYYFIKGPDTPYTIYIDG
ncbi:hypothetical protein BN903_120 [Halorubrum sp. AJ67]|nr:hypothetical protein BN903_120 [Halorubrum sp. AJ67]